MAIKEKNILYPSRVEQGNLGDILINGLLIRELLKYSNVYIKGEINKELFHFISKDNTYLNRLKILKINNSNVFLYKLNVLFFIIRHRNFDYVFDTPGHIAGNNKPLKVFLKAILNLIYITIYRLMGIKTVKYGVTIGPLSAINMMLYRLISKICKLIVVRDAENYATLVQHKFSNLQLKPDLAYLLNNYIHAKNNQPINKKDLKITLSIRGSISGTELNYGYFSEVNEKLIKLILLLNSKYRIKQINLTHQVDYDKVTMRELQYILEREIAGIDIRLCNDQLDLKMAIDHYSNSDYVITNRLHVFLLSMMVNTKTLIVTDTKKHLKLISIAKDLDLTDLIYDPESQFDFENNSAIEKFRTLSESYNKELVSHICELLTQSE